MPRHVRSLIFTAFLLATLPAVAQREWIPDYHSDILVQADGSMMVRETITVVSARNQIRHGIYRDFPTQYTDRYGNRYAVGFKVLSAECDGATESFRTESLPNGVRVYVGDKKTLVSRGEHVYVINYETNRQIGFFPDHDELYWNVTGNGWIFGIGRASATVRLPDGVLPADIRLDGYTGRQGAHGKLFSASVKDGAATFETTQSLPASEGLTIVVSWPKGFVAAPDASARIEYFLEDNAPVLAGLACLLVLLAYYGWAWFAVGRDPERGTIVVRYEPPTGFSPAAVRYLMQMGFDNKAVAAAVLDMAVKGYVFIDKDFEGTYTLTRTGKPRQALSPDEKAIFDLLFAKNDEIELKQANNLTIRFAIAKLTRALSVAEDKIYFFKNTEYFIPGIVLSVASLIVVVLITPGELKSVGAFMVIWLSPWSMVLYAFINQAVRLWKGGMTGQALLLTLFAGFLGAAEFSGLGVLARALSVGAMLVIACIIGVNFLFHRLLKVPTVSGRLIMDQIEGFKMFLSAVESDRLNRMNPPERTPALFEKYLPYALALDVEQQWAEQFSDVLATASTGQAYSPGWYSGAALGFSAVGFASSFGGSFSVAISTSATAPGSASGAGGGGSSGGGGGGGGGGGW